MSFTKYISIIIIALVIAFILFIYRSSKKINSGNELYDEGVRNENNGDYVAALKSYQEALQGMNPESKLRDQIIQRIKIIKLTLDYENQFHTQESTGNSVDDLPR